MVLDESSPDSAYLKDELRRGETLKALRPIVCNNENNDLVDALLAAAPALVQPALVASLVEAVEKGDGAEYERLVGKGFELDAGSVDKLLTLTAAEVGVSTVTKNDETKTPPNAVLWEVLARHSQLAVLATTLMSSHPRLKTEGCAPKRLAKGIMLHYLGPVMEPVKAPPKQGLGVYQSRYTDNNATAYGAGDQTFERAIRDATAARTMGIKNWEMGSQLDFFDATEQIPRMLQLGAVSVRPAKRTSTKETVVTC